MFERQFPVRSNRGWQLEGPGHANRPFVPDVYESPVAETGADTENAADVVSCGDDLTDPEQEQHESTQDVQEPPAGPSAHEMGEAAQASMGPSEDSGVDHASAVAVLPVDVGIDPEEVVRREADHYARGVEQGAKQAREAMAQEVTAQRVVLENIVQELHALLNDSARFFEPMKRLCLHLAEQITLAELRTPSHMIEQLIRRCLEALDHPAHGAVVVELHPQDLARMHPTGGDSLQELRLEAASDLAPGSVRLYVNDTVVEDLVQNRLEVLARTLNIQTEAWLEHSVLLTPPQPSQEGGHSDVHHS